MRFVLLSDLHAHPHEQFATTLPSGRNSRFQNILDVLKEVTEFCNKKGVDYLFFLGDLFHSRTKIDVDVYSATWMAMRDLCCNVREAYILVGNHDQFNKKGSIHSLEPFSEFATIVDLPMIEKVGPIRFAAHPFTTDIDQWHSFVKMLPNDLDFFFFHQGICEAAVGAFDISIKAEVAYSDLPFNKATWCLGGHFHRSQWIGEEQRVGYVGSPLQHSFAERLEEKGFLYFESGPSHRPFFIPTSAPRFVQITGDAFFDEVGDAYFDGQATSWSDGDFVRVVNCTQEQADAVKREFPRFQTEIARIERYEENRVSDEVVNSDEALLSAYVEKESTNGLDHSRLLQFGMGILTTTEE